MSDKPKRRYHAWGWPDENGVERCPCGCERKPGAKSWRWLWPDGQWRWGAPPCSRPEPPPRPPPSPREMPEAEPRPEPPPPAPPTTPDELYASLDDRWRLVMGSCVLTQPPLHQSSVARILGVTHQRVEQMVSAIYERADGFGIALPPRNFAKGGYLGAVNAFRSKAHGKLGVRTSEARALDGARSARLGVLLAHVREELCWCSVCQTFKPRGEFYDASTRYGHRSAYCRPCHNDYYQRRSAAEPWGVCFECLEEPAAPGSRRCAGCEAKKEQRRLAGQKRSGDMRRGRKYARRQVEA